MFTIHSMGLSHSLDNISSERARPIYTSNSKLKYGQNSFVLVVLEILDLDYLYRSAQHIAKFSRSTELRNFATSFPLRFSSHTHDKNTNC